MKEAKVLTVCLGNINRSPASHYIVREAGYPVKSCGVGKGSARGNKMTRKMQAAMGIDFSEHRSQIITQELVDWADHILIMTEKHAIKVATDFPSAAHKLFVFDQVADPYHTKDYTLAAEHIKNETNRFLQTL